MTKLNRDRKAILRRPVGECLALLDTGWKCHLLGGTISLLLIGGMIAVRSISIDSSVPLDIAGELVSEDKAHELQSDADKYRAEFLKLSSKNKALEDRTQTIAKWLRRHIDPLTEQERISQLAFDHGVSVTSLKPGSVHTGSRVAVWSATCSVTGNYENLCRWMQALSSADLPISCRSIELRKSTEDDSIGAATGPACTAQIELRVPFQGDATAADMILPAERESEVEGLDT